MWALPVAWFSATGPPETAAGEAATTALQIMQLRTGSRTFCKCSALSCGAAALLLAGATEDSGCVAVWRMGRARDSGAGASSGAAGDPEALEGAAFEEVQLCTVKPSAAGYTTGMCMAVMLDDHPPVEGTSTERMWLWAMYESGDLFAFDVSDSRVGDAPADPKAALEPVMRIPMSKESGLVFVLSSTRAAAAAGSAEAAVAFAQLGDNKQSRVSVPRAGVGALALRADDRVLAAGCWDGTYVAQPRCSRWPHAARSRRS